MFFHKFHFIFDIHNWICKKFNITFQNCMPNMSFSMSKTHLNFRLHQIVAYWVTQKLPQICTVILRIRIGKVAWFAVYICGNFWVTQYIPKFNHSSDVKTGCQLCFMPSHVNALWCSGPWNCCTPGPAAADASRTGVVRKN